MHHMKTKSSIFIKSARNAFGLTQDQFAKQLKIERYNLAKYERSISMPPGDLVLSIRELLQKGQGAADNR